MMNNNAFDSIKIGLASLSKLEPGLAARLKPETINYRTLKPERERLVLRAYFRTYKGLGVPLR